MIKVGITHMIKVGITQLGLIFDRNAVLRCVNYVRYVKET